jgi:hypothetical protein
MNQKFVKSQKFEKWLKWMGTIHDEIQSLVREARMFREVQDMIRNNPSIQEPNSFYRYLERSYFFHTLAGLRRQIRHQKNSISFVGLLEDIAENPNVLSFSYYLSIRNSESDFQCFQRSGIPFSYREMIEEEFKRYADPNCEHVCPEMVKGDLKKLKEAAKPWLEFADRRVAHRDKRDPKVVPTGNQLDGYIKLLDKMYVKYYLLFHSEGMTTLYPEPQYDWKTPFRTPWLSTSSK